MLNTTYFANKRLDAITLCNILQQKSFHSKMPSNINYQSVLITHATPITTIYLFSYKHVLQVLIIDDFTSNYLECTCASSLSIYNPTGHVNTSDLSIVHNT